MDQEPPTHSLLPVQAVRNGTPLERDILRKHVGEIAIEPLPGSKALNVTTRKVLNVMRHIAQKQFNERGVYTAPLSALLRGSGSSLTNSQRLMRYLGDAQMLVMRANLFVGDRSLNLFDDEVQEPRKHPSIRQFQVLGQVNMDFENGQWVVTWYYAPAVNDMLRPERYARIDLGYMSGLSLYAAVVLYETCSRFRDSPSGLTSRADIAFWMNIMREQSKKPMEWRRFKYTLLNPAIAEVNAVTDLTVELLEFKRGKAIVEAQFKITAKQPTKLIGSQDAADLTLLVSCEGLGLKEHQMQPLIEKYGEVLVQRVVDRIYEAQQKTPRRHISNMLKYLKSALENESAAGLFDEEPNTEAEQGADRKNDGVLAQIEERQAAEHAKEGEQNKALLFAIEALPDDERLRLIQQVKDHPLGKKFAGDESDWANPMYRALLLSVYKSSLEVPNASDAEASQQA
jgi:Initiator Replication protein